MTNPSNVIAVRPATNADLPRIGFLGDMLVKVHNEFDAERFIATRPRTPADYAAFMGTQLGKPDIAIFVAHVNDDVIGYAYCAVEGYDYMQLRGPAGVVHDIIVDPEYRGRGIGKQLLDASLEFLRSHGAPRVVLTTADRNGSALRLFENAGFRRTMVEMTRELN